jgi:hypothetical protein
LTPPLAVRVGIVIRSRASESRRPVDRNTEVDDWRLTGYVAWYGCFLYECSLFGVRKIVLEHPRLGLLVPRDVVGLTIEPPPNWIYQDQTQTEVLHLEPGYSMIPLNSDSEVRLWIETNRQSGRTSTPTIMVKPYRTTGADTPPLPTYGQWEPETRAAVPGRNPAWGNAAASKRAATPVFDQATKRQKTGNETQVSTTSSSGYIIRTPSGRVTFLGNRSPETPTRAVSLFDPGGKKSVLIIPQIHPRGTRPEPRK